MEQLLHTPGFKERIDLGFPGEQMRILCEQNGIDYTRMVLPGDPENSDTDSRFSLTQTREALVKTLSDLDKPAYVSSYCLTAPSVIEAVNQVPDAVKGLILLRPVYDSVHSVRVMDGMMNQNLSNLKPRSAYLDPNNTGIFDTLIHGWEGDADEFVSDLQVADERTAHPHPSVDTLNVLDEKDLLMHANLEAKIQEIAEKAGKRANMLVMWSHIPKILGTSTETEILDFMRR